MQRTVVVVDDEAKIRVLMRSYLEREGYTVLEAGTGARAVELAPGADLMILDLGLPDRAGGDPVAAPRLVTTVPGIGYKLAVDRDA